MHWSKSVTKIAYVLLVLTLAAAAVSMRLGFTGYFAYTTGSSSRLELWDSAEPLGGSRNSFISEQAMFFANFTSLATSNPINSSAVYCRIMFNISGGWTSPVNMTYNQTSRLYQYNRTLSLNGNYSWNALCDGSPLGYNVLNTTDGIVVHRYEWWNNTWKFRVKVEIQNGNYNVTDWPIERDLNFTDALRQLGDSGTFDENSTRAIEYNSTGGGMSELPSQFDRGEGYASANAIGTEVFIMNGTTPNNTRRTFFVYFDIVENGAKQHPNYATNLSYLWNGDEIEFNNSRIEFYLDTNRSENTSGLYRANFKGEIQRFFMVDETGRTVEYMEYSNSTHNFSFDLSKNITIVQGPVRLTIIQSGDEVVFGNTSLVTGEGAMVKKYYVYNKAGPEELGTWIKMEQNYTNRASYAVDRNSTLAGAIAFDAARGWQGIGSSPEDFLGNSTDPYSWYIVQSNNKQVVGFVNLNETKPEFFVTNNTEMGRVGVQLENNTINQGGSIIEKAALYIGSGSADEFFPIKDALGSPPEISMGQSEPRILNSYVSTDYVVYNRNETIFITVNVTYDPYGLLNYVNISLDNGTAGTGDDFNITMYDDGTHGDQNASDGVYSNRYNVSNAANTGEWTATALLFDGNKMLLNQSLKEFNITKSLYVTTVVTNPDGLISTVRNATVTVKNYRQDVLHPNATVNCTVFYGTTPLYDVPQANIMDNGNGNYSLNFTAPSYYGGFILNCSANKTGNDGYGTGEFTTEDIGTNVTIEASPAAYNATNVTWLSNQSFLITVNATNTENATAYNATISLSMPVNITANATSFSCGEKFLAISKSCVAVFNITVLNTTAPGSYRVNASVGWDNANQPHKTNETYVNVTVGPTRILDVPEANVAGTVAAGKKKNIQNITVRSYGNAELNNVTFNITGFPAQFNFTFQPENLSNLTAGNTSKVLIFLQVSLGYPSGDYSGTLNVTSADGGYRELQANITVSGTNMSINVTPGNFSAENITYYIGQNFTINASAMNMENATAYNANFTLQFSSGYITTSNATPYQCGSKAKSESCSALFNIVISNGTPAGNYSVNVSVLWDNPEIGVLANSTLVNITVLANVTMTIAESEVKGNISHESTGILGNFTANSSGNNPVQGVQYLVIDPNQELKNFIITVSPNLTSFSPGQFARINVSVAVPRSYPPGNYSGYLNVTSGNDGYKLLNLNVTVPANRTWLIEEPASLSCQHTESTPYGIVCNVTINNTGNANITFNITPKTNGTSMNNQTWTEVVDFIVENQTKLKFSVFYNVTGVPFLWYASSYNITGVQSTPANRTLSIQLLPYVSPILEANITPASALIEEKGNVEISAGVTSQSGIPINFTYLNVTRPDNTTDSIRMRRFGAGTDPYLYLIGYPTDSVNGTWGNSTLRGNYTFVVYAQDNIGLNSTANGSFYAYAVLAIDSRATRTSAEYYQGESGTVTYKVRDAAGFMIGGVNVSIGIKDSTGRTVNVKDGDFITNSQGEPAAYPNFELFSDSPVGNYTVTASSWYNDTPIGKIITNTTASNFTVIERIPGMLLLDLAAPAQTGTSDGLDVVAMLTDGVSNIDPTSISVSLFDPLDNAILDSQPMTRLSTGRYARWYNTSSSSNQGNWKWVVTAVKGSSAVTKDVFTRLVGGPFDVRNITIIDNTVTDLSISVIIENTGGLTQDAFVHWNLTRADTGELLNEGLETVRIDGNSEYTYTAGPADISYIGQVRITFIVTYSGTEKAGAYSVFSTEESVTPPKPPGPPSGGGAGPSPGPGPAGPAGPSPNPGMSIINYPKEIATEVGWTQYPSITVNNTGNMILHNIKLSINGIPATWYTIQPVLMPILRPGETTTFVVNLLVPSGTEAKQYYGFFNATADETYDEKMTSVIIFGSREELVKYQLKRLREEFENFKDDVNATAKEGKKDLSRVNDIIGEIQHQIDLTGGYLTAKMFDEALDSVTTGWRLLERGKELLRAAPPIKPVTIIEIPDWLIFVMLALVIVVLALILMITKYKKKLNRMFRREVPQARAAAEMTGTGPSALAEEERVMAGRATEREKIRKVLNLLEKEYKEGLISEKAYSELKKRNESKLKEFEK